MLSSVRHCVDAHLKYKDPDISSCTVYVQAYS